VGVQGKERAEDCRDGAARPEHRDAGVGVRAEQERRRRLQRGGGEAAGDVEAQVTEVAERVLDVLPKIARKSRFAAISATFTIGKRRARMPAESGSIGYLLRSGTAAGTSCSISITGRRSAGALPGCCRRTGCGCRRFAAGAAAGTRRSKAAAWQSRPRRFSSTRRDEHEEDGREGTGSPRFR
jgi:hypothetical protein